MAKALLLNPTISTNARPVAARGPWPFMVLLLGLPVLALVIALADDRTGFRLLMAGLAVTGLVLVMGLAMWNHALAAGRIRIRNTGPLHFVPPATVLAASLGVAIAFQIPALTALVVGNSDLPTMTTSTRFTMLGPPVLALVGLVLLARSIWSVRTPVGLRVTADGLDGVRGARPLSLAWDEIDSADAPGPHGPHLALLTTTGNTIVIETHYIGSDPAIVARILQHYRDNPAQRHELEDGQQAVRVVEDDLGADGPQ
ncbi:MAG: hypothetical protein ACK5KU_08355 [Beutenbergiaceae bacterium]